WVEGERAQTVDHQAAGASERGIEPIAAAGLVLKDDRLAGERSGGAGENQAAAGDNCVGAAIAAGKVPGAARHRKGGGGCERNRNGRGGVVQEQRADGGAGGGG